MPRQSIYQSDYGKEFRGIIAEQIKYERQKRNWTQKDLSKASSVSQPTIVGIEKGGSVLISSILAVLNSLDLDLKLIKK